MTKILTFRSTFTNSLACTQLSLAVHPEKSQCGNGTKLNTKLGQLYLSFSNMSPYPHGNDYLLLLLLGTRTKMFWLQTAHISSSLLWPYGYIPLGGGSKLSSSVWLTSALHTFSKEKTAHRRQYCSLM